MENFQGPEIHVHNDVHVKMGGGCEGITAQGIREVCNAA